MRANARVRRRRLRKACSRCNSQRFLLSHLQANDMTCQLLLLLPQLLSLSTAVSLVFEGLAQGKSCFTICERTIDLKRSKKSVHKLKTQTLEPLPKAYIRNIMLL